MLDTLPLTTFLLIGASALLLAIGVVPLMRQIALQTGTVDRPAARKIHSAPVPLLGGVAIYLTFILVLFFFGDRNYINEAIGIFVGASFMSFMGIIDDRWGLGSYVKLAGQVGAAAILIYSGVKVQLFDSWLDIAVTLVWVVGITNALNLLDNMDGLSGGVAMIAAIFFTLLAAMSKQYLVGVLAAALAGACAGFLIYKRYRGRLEARLSDIDARLPQRVGSACSARGLLCAGLARFEPDSIRGAIACNSREGAIQNCVCGGFFCCMYGLLLKRGVAR